MQNSAFNADEIAAQMLAGGGPRGNGIRDFMPEQHRQFFSGLPYVFVGGIDAAGWPLATLLSGEPGFLQSPNANPLEIGVLPSELDPANEALVAGRNVALLGIDFSTRRRNRANGRIESRSAHGLRVTVSQSFGNCPQYIQARDIATVTRTDDGATAAVEAFDHLDDAAKSAIRNADTFLVASRSRSGDADSQGADISHRGGRPGFVRVDGDVLTIPDFRGNRYFNTLGNFLAEPRASLLFVDFQSGDTLQLQGLVAIDWSATAAAELTGAERIWRFSVKRGWRRRSATSLRWQFAGYSPVTLHTGVWQTPA